VATKGVEETEGRKGVASEHARCPNERDVETLNAHSWDHGGERWRVRAAKTITFAQKTPKKKKRLCFPNDIGKRTTLPERVELEKREKDTVGLCRRLRKKNGARISETNWRRLLGKEVPEKKKKG